MPFLLYVPLQGGLSLLLPYWLEHQVLPWAFCACVKQKQQTESAAIGFDRCIHRSVELRLAPSSLMITIHWSFLEISQQQLSQGSDNSTASPSGTMSFPYNQVDGWTCHREQCHIFCAESMHQKYSILPIPSKEPNLTTPRIYVISPFHAKKFQVTVIVAIQIFILFICRPRTSY